MSETDSDIIKRNPETLINLRIEVGYKDYLTFPSTTLTERMAIIDIFSKAVYTEGDRVKSIKIEFLPKRVDQVEVTED